MTTNKTYEVHAPTSGSSHFLLKLCRILGMIIMWFFLLLLNIWAVAALYVDCRIPALRIPLIIVYLATLILLLAKVRQHRALSSLLCFTVVLVWWLSLKPSDAGEWRADVARRAWAETSGDRITLHNVRNCDYRSETEYSNCWSDRTFNLSDLRGADFRGTNLSGANLSDAHLDGANFFKAVLDRADLSGAFLNGAQFLNCAQLIVAQNWQSTFQSASKLWRSCVRSESEARSSRSDLGAEYAGS